MLKASFLSFCLISAIAFAGNNFWTPTASFGVPVSSFALSTTDVNVVFFSSPNGTYRSKDGGVSWARVAAEITGIVRVDPKDANHLLGLPDTRLQRRGGLFESLDGGDSWTRISKIEFADVQFHSTNPGVLYALHRRGDFYVSYDRGQHWTKRGLAAKCCGKFTVHPGNGDIIYVAIHTLRSVMVYKSTDRGVSFVPVGAQLPLPTVTSLVLDPLHSGNLYISSDDRIFKISDASSNWIPVTNFESFLPSGCFCLHGLSINPFSGDLYAATGSVLIRSNDGGMNWNPIRLPVQTFGSPLAPTFHTIVKDLLFTSIGEGVLRSTNDGNSWFRFRQGLKGQGISDLEAHPKDKGKLFAVFRGALYGSDKASPWKFLNPFPSFFVNDFVIHPKNSNFWIAVGSFQHSSEEGNLAITRDSGKTWQIRNASSNSTKAATLVAVDPANEKVIYSNDRSLYKSEDQGLTWKQLNLNTASGVRELVVDPMNSNHLLALVEHGISSFLFVSNDGGNSWIDTTSSVGDSVESITVSPIDHDFLYAVVRLGHTRYYAVRGDSFGNWAGLQRISGPGKIQVDPLNPNRVFITQSPGLLVSIDAGNHWANFDLQGIAGVRRRNIQQLIIGPSNNDYFVRTEDGIFAYKRSEVQGSPNIIGISKPAAKPGETIQIIGSFFGSTPSGNQVFFGDTPGNILSWTDSLIEVQVPTLDEPVVPVSVSANSSVSNAQEFVIQPSADSFLPQSGQIGTDVAIRQSFPIDSDERILFGDFLVNDFTQISKGILILKAPSGTGSVQVTYKLPSVSLIKAGTFTYQP